jgi:hypothetical protein
MQIILALLLHVLKKHVCLFYQTNTNNMRQSEEQCKQKFKDGKYTRNTIERYDQGWYVGSLYEYFDSTGLKVGFFFIGHCLINAL